MIINKTCSLNELRMEAAVCKRQITVDAAYHLRRILVRDHYGRDMADVPLRSFVAAVDEAVQCGPEIRPHSADSFEGGSMSNDKMREALKTLKFLRSIATDPFCDNTAVNNAYEEVKAALQSQQPESEPIQPLDYVETPCSGIAKVQDLSSARLGAKMWRVRLLEPNFHGEYRIIPESRLAKLYTSPQPTPQVPEGLIVLPRAWEPVIWAVEQCADRCDEGRNFSVVITDEVWREIAAAPSIAVKENESE